MNRKIIVTEDNSKTLLISDINETYHSIKGAYNEAIHVFIKAGLDFIPTLSTVRIFEMGFGTGLNAMVTLDRANQENRNVSYTSTEKYPLDIQTIKELNYPALIPDSNLAIPYFEMHKTPWENFQTIAPNFNLKKIKGDITSLTLSKNQFDLIYFDAFGPKIQPDLWTVEVLQKMYNSLDTQGILVTYCAQGQFKRNLKSVGFKVENLPGPPGKREMTRAIKNESMT